MAEVSVPTLGAVKEAIHSFIHSQYFILFFLLYLPSPEYLSRHPFPREATGQPLCGSGILVVVVVGNVAHGQDSYSMQVSFLGTEPPIPGGYG